jgi:aminobenzoyl-glutamate utilization protein B
VIALTGLDLLTQPDLLRRAKAEFQAGTGGRPYQSPIPEGQKPPPP